MRESRTILLFLSLRTIMARFCLKALDSACHAFVRSGKEQNKKSLSYSFLSRTLCTEKSEIRGRGRWKRGICINLSEIDFQTRDKFATILRTLRLTYETKYRQFGANLVPNVGQICTTPPSRTPPSREV